MNHLEETFGLAGKVAYVTGASGGLGVEFADALASAGADIVVMARRREALEEVAADIARRHKVRALAVDVDLADTDAIPDAFARARDGLGPCDVLVNNAGIAPTGRAEKQRGKAWDDTVALNLTALFHAALEAHAHMTERGQDGESGGRIINLTSIFARRGSPIFRVSAYAATKGGVDNLTRQLAVEWAPEGITVNAIAPAWFPSDMTAGSLGKGGIEEKMASGNPMGRIGRPEELRSACLFLAAPASSYVTGTTVHVDGGYSAW